MAKWACVVCGYIYDEAEGDPENGIEPGVRFEDLPDDFVCPLCGVGKTNSKKSTNRHKKRDYRNFR